MNDPRVSTRRSFLTGISLLAGGSLAPSALAITAESPASAGAAPGSDFPRLDSQLVETFVSVAHRDLSEVRHLVELHPALANASWDWGFGDWETALGAAAHTGGRDIALLLLARGAHPTLFSAAMLGHLDVVRALVAASPGIQGVPGPHGLTLLHHARSGGAPAEGVVAYLEKVGGADQRPRPVALEPGDRDLVVGRYVFGSGERDYFDVTVEKDLLGIQRPGASRRILVHAGGLVFFPSGVPSVRIAFERSASRVIRLTIADPEVFLTAQRQD